MAVVGPFLCQIDGGDQLLVATLAYDLCIFHGQATGEDYETRGRDSMSW
jgi:hypothetical protein